MFHVSLSPRFLVKSHFSILPAIKDRNIQKPKEKNVFISKACFSLSNFPSSSSWKLWSGMRILSFPQLFITIMQSNWPRLVVSLNKTQEAQSSFFSRLIRTEHRVLQTSIHFSHFSPFYAFQFLLCKLSSFLVSNKNLLHFRLLAVLLSRTSTQLGVFDLDDGFLSRKTDFQ